MNLRNMEATFRTVERLTASGRPVQTRQVAAAMHRAAHTVSATLWHLYRVGWLDKIERDGPRGGRKALFWALSAKAKQEPYAPGLPYTDTPERVMALVTDDSAWTIRRLTDTMQRPYETVRRAVQRLIRDGELVMHYEDGAIVVTRPLLDDDDDWQPPTTYISASRAYALGLR